MRLDIAAQTDIGRRKRKNEDACAVYREDTPGLRFFEQGALLSVADGLGGHLGGEIASKLAVSHVKDLLQQPPPAMPTSNEELDESDIGPLPAMRAAIFRANESIYRDNIAHGIARTGKGMGTTLLTALVEPGRVYIGNVGDSRAYHLRGGEIIDKTEDHSWVDEQVRLGRMSKAEAETDRRKNVVTRCVGTHAQIEVDTYRWFVVPGDMLLLCSDGLVNMVADKAIQEIFRRHGTAAEIAQKLVQTANDNGGRDNITVIVASISPKPLRLIYLRLRSALRHHGRKMLWGAAWILSCIASFAAGYLIHQNLGQ
jgi:PPM family protein phosphatase